MLGFAIYDNKGFQITFANDVTVSIQFGGNYCDNRTSYVLPDCITPQECVNVEVAIWDKNRWITQEYDPNLPYEVIEDVTPDEVAKIIAWAQAYKGV